MSGTPYEKGWLAAHREQVKANPYHPGTDERAEYERGYVDKEIDALTDEITILKQQLERSRNQCRQWQERYEKIAALADESTFLKEQLESAREKIRTMEEANTELWNQYQYERAK